MPLSPHFASSYNYEKIRYGVPIKHTDIGRLVLSFLWAFLDVSDPWEAFDRNVYIHHYSLSNYYRKIPNLNPRNLEYRYMGDLARQNFNSFVPDHILIIMLDDYYDYMWEQYQQIAEEQGEIDSRDGWRLLVPPDYYIVREPGSDDIRICRYNRK